MREILLEITSTTSLSNQPSTITGRDSRKIPNTGSALKSSDGGNINDTWVNLTVTTPFCTIPDTTPPGNITGLSGTVDSCSQITWDWTNPADADYSLVMIYKNDVFYHNLTSPDNDDVWGGLAASTNYLFSSRTVDTTGNVNTSWTNSTESTTACPAPPIADFVVDDQTICAGDTATFTDTPAGGGVTSWYWEFGDGGDDNVEDPTYQYLVPGIYDVNLKETNADGSDWENKTDYMTSRTVPRLPPSQRMIRVSATIPRSCSPILLPTPRTTGTGTSGRMRPRAATNRSPVTSFSTPGTYSIRLFAQNTYGSDFENKTDYITVTDCTPDTTPPESVTDLDG